MKAKELYTEQQIISSAQFEIDQVNKRINSLINTSGYDVISDKIDIYLFDDGAEIKTYVANEDENITCMFNEQLEPFAYVRYIKSGIGYVLKDVTYNQFYQ